jgi:Zn-dependent protease with chaperone function
MDFFEQQHRARRHTGLMVLMFLLAVAGIVISINVVGGAIYLYATDRPLLPVVRALAAVPRSAYVVTTLVVLGVVAWGTLTRMYDLSGGGASLALMVGARRVKRDSQSPPDRRLLNVVEEMAVASGVVVPQVYVMDGEPAINAFAAGYSPNEAAVIVTQGTLDNLSRDELQGVVAHEFSHILNGDMRLNVRLLGVIAGIVLIGSIGGFIMRLGRGGSGTRGDIRVWLVGLVLWLLGSVGVVAGRLIKSAISREREFLADASAVQFTRNPEGIGGALYKIAQRGSAVSERHAEEISHMCISVPVSDFFDFDWFSTHPPLEERIERVMGPQGVGLLQEREKREPAAPAGRAAAAPGGAGATLPEAMLAAAGIGAPGQRELRTTPQALIASVGSPSTAHVEYARRILEELPGELRVAAGNAEGGRALLAAMLLGEGEVRAKQLAAIRVQAGEAVAARAASFAELMRPLGPRARMPLFDLALPSLKRMEQDARDILRRMLKDLAETDAKVTVGEFVLLTLCERHLGAAPKGAPPVKHRSIDAVAGEAGVLMSLLAHAGGSGMPAFNAGMTALGLSGGVLRAPAELTIAAVESALYELKLLAPLKKPILIKACLEVVMADGRLTVAEGELMRAICAALDTPLPPIIETELETTETV